VELPLAGAAGCTAGGAAAPGFSAMVRKNIQKMRENVRSPLIRTTVEIKLLISY
jgi:hypothetical protein